MKTAGVLFASVAVIIVFSLMSLLTSCGQHINTYEPTVTNMGTNVYINPDTDYELTGKLRATNYTTNNGSFQFILNDSNFKAAANYEFLLAHTTNPDYYLRITELSVGDPIISIVEGQFIFDDGTNLEYTNHTYILRVEYLPNY